MDPIQVLYEREGLSGFPLGEALAGRYGGDFGVGMPRVYANFVASLDGVVALPGPVESGRILSGGDDADRFVMGLLRSFADAVVVGAGTFRRADGDLWHPEAASPRDGEHFADLRRRLGLRKQPLFVVVTGSGVIDPTQMALRDSLVLTTAHGESRLRGTLPEGATLVVLENDPIRPQAMLALLHRMGLQRILVEGGPTLLGCFLGANLVDELFLSIAPRLFGPASSEGRKALVDGDDLAGRSATLLSLRRHGSFLFARYRLKNPG